MKNLARGGNKLFLLLLIFCCFFMGVSRFSQARGQPVLRIVGSSAMYPFLTAVSERFGYEKKSSVPVVEATGTGGGIKFFCTSVKPDSPSLVAASRPMSDREKDFCRRNGVNSFLEIPLGLDGIVLVEPKTSRGSLFKNSGNVETCFQDSFVNMSMDDLFKAVAHPDGFHKKELPFLWSDINSCYPSVPIKILAPSTSSGTREAFENLLLKGVSARQGRAFKSSADQEAVLVQKLLKARQALGILSFPYLEKNKETLRPVSLNGVAPTRESIREKRYPLVRKVFIYVKGAHLSDHPFLESFLRYLVSPEIERLLSENGLIALKKENQQKRYRDLMNFISLKKRREEKAL